MLRLNLLELSRNRNDLMTKYLTAFASSNECCSFSNSTPKDSAATIAIAGAPLTCIFVIAL